MAEAGGEAGIGKGSLRASDALCKVKRGGGLRHLGLGSGWRAVWVAADGAIARRRRATAWGACEWGSVRGRLIYMSGAILSKPLTYYAWQRGAGI